jgi:hypothetical protein
MFIVCRSVCIGGYKLFATSIAIKFALPVAEKDESASFFRNNYALDTDT